MPKVTTIKKEIVTPDLKIKKIKVSIKEPENKLPVKEMKHELQKRTMVTLQKTFTNIEKLVGEKKFRKQIKKASKELLKGAVKK